MNHHHDHHSSSQSWQISPHASADGLKDERREGERGGELTAVLHSHSIHLITFIQNSPHPLVALGLALVPWEVVCTEACFCEEETILDLLLPLPHRNF